MILAIGACRTLRFLHWHVLFLIAAGLLYPVQGQAQLQEIPHTVAHEILAIEAELGNSLDSSILDAIIREAAVHIPRKPSYTRQEALDILTTIFDITIEKGFLYKASSFTLGQSLTPRHLSGNEIELLSSYDNLYRSFVQSDLMYFHHYCPGCVLYLDRERQEPVVMTDPGGRYYFTQCATLSFIYLAVAETLDLPMQALSLPLHIAIRWQLDDGTYINWQPLNGRQESDEQMARSYAIDPSLISSGVYLRSLTRNEVLALGWFLVGVAWMERNDTFHAQYAMENSLFLDDFHPLTHYHLGVIHHTNEQYLTALHHYTQSLALDDTFARTHLGRGWSFFRLGEYEEAAQDFSRSLQIDGNLAEAYMGLGWAYYKRGNNEAAVVEFNKALELNPELPSAYIGRSAALDALGRSDEARADMDMADNLEQHPTSLSGAGNGSGQDQEDILTQVEALDVQMTVNQLADEGMATILAFVDKGSSDSLKTLTAIAEFFRTTDLDNVQVFIVFVDAANTPDLVRFLRTIEDLTPLISAAYYGGPGVGSTFRVNEPPSTLFYTARGNLHSRIDGPLDIYSLNSSINSMPHE